MGLESKQDCMGQRGRVSYMKGTPVTNIEGGEGLSVIVDTANQDSPLACVIQYLCFLSHVCGSGGGWLIKDLLFMSLFLIGPAGWLRHVLLGTMLEM